MSKSVNFKPYAALFLGLSFMCFSAVLIRSSHAPGIVSVFYRMSIGALALLVPFLIHIFRNRPKLPKKGILLAVLAGSFFAADMAFWSTGVMASNATIPTLFGNTAPFWAGLGSMIFFKDKLRKGFWIGLLIAFSGIPLIVNFQNFQNDGLVKGILMGLAAGFFYGAFYIPSQMGRKHLNTLSFLFISTFTSAIVLTILMLILKYPLTGYDSRTWFNFFALGLGVQVVGWFFINYSQGFLPATLVAPTLLGQPVITAFLAAFLLSEYLTPIQILGGLIVVFGIYFIHYSRNKKINLKEN